MKTYSTRYFYLSSYLIANGCDLLDNIVENGVTTFVFENNDGVKRLIGNYYSLKSKVEPMAYGQAIQQYYIFAHYTTSNEVTIP